MKVGIAAFNIAGGTTSNLPSTWKKVIHFVGSPGFLKTTDVKRFAVSTKSGPKNYLIDGYELGSTKGAHLDPSVVILVQRHWHRNRLTHSYR